MLFNPQFEYPKLKRIDSPDGRKYVTPDGESLPSVTTILSATKTAKQEKALSDWRNRVGHEKAKQITTTAAGLGTIVHNQLERYILGQELKWGNNTIQLMAKNMVETVIEQGLSKITCVYGLEASLYYTGLFSGTADLIIGIGNQILIADFKNTIKMKKREWIDDYFTQMTFYATAHNNMFGTEINSAKVMMVARPNETTNICEYKEFDIEGLEYNKYYDICLAKLEQFYG